MDIGQLQYRDAQSTLHYIEGIKEELANVLFSKTRLPYSGIHIATEEYEHTVQCISELIDDLYRNHIREAKHIAEKWNQQ